MKMLTALLLVLTLGMSGCSWVKLTPEGDRVSVQSEAAVSGCKELGTTTVSLLATVAGIDRNADTVQEELNTLARNSAGKFGGNVVVPIDKANNGEQVFKIYRCN